MVFYQKLKHSYFTIDVKNYVLCYAAPRDFVEVSDYDLVKFLNKNKNIF